MLPTVTATRYVTPLREGGSLPGLMEADDLGTYVVKFRGAGQGRKALVAEVVSASLARALGLPVPDLVGVEVDPVLAAGEPDEEVQDLLRASGGLNLGVDFLPGALDFDLHAFPVAPDLAGRVLWFDAWIGNVDRSWRNPNLLVWHGGLHLIDHGAALTFHHQWASAAGSTDRPYNAGDHVLIGAQPDIDGADAALATLASPDVLLAAVADVPDEWLVDEPGFESAAAVRAAYVDWLAARLAARQLWLPQSADGAESTAAYGPTCLVDLWRARGRTVSGTRHVFEYAVLRVVPRVERGEAINAGVLVYCRELDYLGCRVHLDRDRLLALDPSADVAAIDSALHSVVDACGPDGAGASAGEDIGKRFRWATAPRSTVVQPGPVHTGLTSDPDAEADRLFTLLVSPVPPAERR